MEENTDKNLPETKFKAGAVSATVWANPVKRPTGEEGIFRTVQLDRCYKDKEGNWKNSGSFRVNDLPKAVLVMNKAYEYLTTRGSAEGTAETIEELMGDDK